MGGAGKGAGSSRYESTLRVSESLVGVSRKGLESNFDLGIGLSRNREFVGIGDETSDLDETLARSDWGGGES